MSETQKAKLRKELRKQLKELPEAEKKKLDRMITGRVMNLPEIVSAGTVFAYASLSWETGTDEILQTLWDRKYAVYLPKVMGDTMEFFRTYSGDDLLEGTFHIMEPKDGCRSAEMEGGTPFPGTMTELSSAPVLVPGMGFTENGVRLGKGGGYYDRFLEKNRNHTMIALAYEFQVVNDLPKDPYDKNVDMIVTERRVIRCRNAALRNREEQPC